WTKVYTHYEVMHMLQKAGVPAGAVLNAEDMLNDPHLAQRGFFWEIDHSEAGTHKYAGQPIRFKRKSTYHKSPAPCLGEHNEYVLVNILGFSHEEVAELEKEGVIGTTPLD
ncbi:MAG: CoA transferase, partial [Thermodesulfobacteriota bacterium]|nr:CoA transferase [Thermodesulfobacteriota bacterium]